LETYLVTKKESQEASSELWDKLVEHISLTSTCSEGNGD